MGHSFANGLEPLGRIQMLYFEILHGVEQASAASATIQQAPVASVLLGLSKPTTFRFTMKSAPTQTCKTVETLIARQALQGAMDFQLATNSPTEWRRAEGKLGPEPCSSSIQPYEGLSS